MPRRPSPTASPDVTSARPRARSTFLVQARTASRASSTRTQNFRALSAGRPKCRASVRAMKLSTAVRSRSIAMIGPVGSFGVYGSAFIQPRQAPALDRHQRSHDHPTVNAAATGASLRRLSGRAQGNGDADLRTCSHTPASALTSHRSPTLAHSPACEGTLDLSSLKQDSRKPHCLPVARFLPLSPGLSYWIETVVPAVFRYCRPM